jgi:hypothetical protein
MFAQPSNLNILSLRIERWMLMVFARRVLAFGASLASLWCVEVAVLPVLLVELSSGASVYHGVPRFNVSVHLMPGVGSCPTEYHERSSEMRLYSHI